MKKNKFRTVFSNVLFVNCNRISSSSKRFDVISHEIIKTILWQFPVHAHDSIELDLSTVQELNPKFYFHKKILISIRIKYLIKKLQLKRKIDGKKIEVKEGRKCEKFGKQICRRKQQPAR